MSILSFIKDLLGQTPEPTPDESIPCNPFVPWELYPDADPCLLRGTQGEEGSWMTSIWFPYWGTLSQEKQDELKASAPTDEWRMWLEWYDEAIPSSRESFEKLGLEFDYRPYLDDFIRQYRLNRMAQRKWEEKQRKKKRNR